MLNYRRHIAETLTLIVAAVLCATVANALASRQRRLVITAPVGVAPARRAATDLPTPSISPAAQLPVEQSQPLAPVQQIETAPLHPSTATTTEPPATTPPANGKSAAKPAIPQPSAPAPASEAKASSEGPAMRFPPHKDVPYVEIDGAQAEWLYKHGALFLDARRTSVYEDGHIPGARPFSVWESDIDQKTEALYGEGRDGEAPIVAYCSGGDCEDSHMLAQKLWGLFFNNVLVYKGGFPEWTARGNPSKSGPQP